jgi:transposase
MATPQQDPLRRWTVVEQAALERLTSASSARVDEARRAWARLEVAQGKPFAQAARRAGFGSATTVANLVARFNRQGMAAVTIAAGRGRTPTYDHTARRQIVRTAQRTPDRKTDGTATWSLSTLERTLRREAFPHLGATTIRRVLEDAGSAYQRTRTWCPTGTAQRQRKAGVVTVVDPRTAEQRG